MGQKKPRNLLGQKKITQPLETKKSHNVLRQQKMMQSLGTKKAGNFLGQQNQAISNDNKTHAWDNPNCIPS